MKGHEHVGNCVALKLRQVEYLKKKNKATAELEIPEEIQITTANEIQSTSWKTNNMQMVAYKIIPQEKNMIK